MRMARKTTMMETRKSPSSLLLRPPNIVAPRRHGDGKWRASRGDARSYVRTVGVALEYVLCGGWVGRGRCRRARARGDNRGVCAGFAARSRFGTHERRAGARRATARREWTVVPRSSLRSRSAPLYI